MNIGNDQPFFLIAGPCQIESQEHALKMATVIKKIAQQNSPLITARSTAFYIDQCPIQELEGMF